jgi:hypothetical protein
MSADYLAKQEAARKLAGRQFGLEVIQGPGHHFLGASVLVSGSVIALKNYLYPRQTQLIA